MEINDDDDFTDVFSASEMSLRGRITERIGQLFDRNVTLGFKLDNLDAPWEYSEEPHVQRRQVRSGHVV